MKRSRSVALVSVLVALAALAMPVAAAPAAARSMVVAKDSPTVVYAPLTIVGSGDKTTSISPNGVVVGNCGWTGIWIYDRTGGNADVDAMAYASIGFITSTTWAESYFNTRTMTGGGLQGGGPMFPDQYWIQQPDWYPHTGWGNVQVTLSTFVATVVTGSGITYCVGGLPTDSAWISQ